jgi:hypothetical protein
MNLVLPETLKKGDVIKYRTGKYRYLIYKIIASEKYGTRIVLVRIVEKDGIKKYEQDPHYDFIHKINQDGNEGGYWDQEVELLEVNHYIPEELQIETVQRGKRDF